MSSLQKTNFNRDWKLQFIEATKEDYLFLNNLALEPYYRYAKSKEQFQDETGNHNVYNYMIYNDKQQFLGYIKGFYPIQDQHLWIQTLLVNKNFSRQGLGTQIVGSFIRAIQSTGNISKIYLTCHKKNDIGNAFWNSLGFVKAKDSVRDTNDLYEIYARSILCNPKFLQP